MIDFVYYLKIKYFIILEIAMYLMFEHKPLQRPLQDLLQEPFNNQLQTLILNHVKNSDDIKLKNNIFELSSLFHLVKMYTKISTN